MVYKLLFVRRSKASFKIYVLQKRKIRSAVLSGQFSSFKFGSYAISDVFVQNSTDRKSQKYFRDIKFFNNCIDGFIRFVSDARNRKILCFFRIEGVVPETFPVVLVPVFSYWFVCSSIVLFRWIY